MILPNNNLRGKRPSAGRTLVRTLLLVFLLGAAVWCLYVVRQISEVADRDEAQQADAIAVFGAAEYAGRPSPTLHFRLDHAVDLYRMKIAPVVITLGGGSDKDSGNTEGGVGRDYLLAHGIPLGNIIAETRSTDTDQQVHRLASIAREFNLHHIVVVSDGTHLFRIRELCEDIGLDVYTSPRATVGHIGWWDLSMRYFHEVLSYTAWKLHLDIGWLRNGFSSDDDY
jgi:uncharacterized SAM-binding protein YcdF (DUF218 family)